MSIDDYPYVSEWVSLGKGSLVVHTGKVDIGQRISTAVAQIAHEELTLPLDRIEVAPVRTGAAPDEGITSGSNSIEQSGFAIRKAAATLRTSLLEHVAERYGGTMDDWSLEDGALVRQGSNRPIPILDLLGEIDLTALRVDPEAKALPRKEKSPSPAMRGIGEMVTGKYVFVHDLERPGMLHARVVRPPHARARLKAIPQSARDSLVGTDIKLVEDGSFLAVAGPVEWQVVKAAARLFAACDWEVEGDGLPDGDVFAQLNAGTATGRLLVVDGLPLREQIPPPLDDTSYDARFERPYLMHAALGPSAAMACWSDGRLDIDSHSQGIYPLRDSIADSLGLAPERVVIAHRPGSGCYGHNGADDAAFEAALVAMALPGRPILLKWSREDEHGWEPFAPAMAVELKARLSDDHRISALSAEAFSDTHRGRPRHGPNRAGAARLLANRFRTGDIPAPVAAPNMNRHGGMHRNLDPIYTIDEKRLVKNLVTGMPHRTSALRCLGATSNVFALESMMDELAEASGLDPITFRRAHLADPRAIAVLERLEALLQDRPAAQGRGIAYAQYKNTMTRVGIGVDIDVSDLGQVLLKHAVIVADAGRVIDSDGLQAQLEGGFIQGASWALCEAVTWDRDGITSRDWDSYPVIRFDNIPEIEVVILDGGDADAVGAGEASPGPAIAAIANALYAATGLRMRRLPFTADAVLRHATAL